jgi:hypothetical protein
VITDPQSPTTRRLAISMVTAALRSDVGTILALLRAVDDGDLATVVYSALSLVRALAGRLLTPQGSLAADLWLAETARADPSLATRAGAELVLAHSQTVGEFDALVVVGVGEYNAICCEADDGFDEVFTAGMLCWRSLLTIAATAAGPVLVGNTAAMLWGSTEPSPPKAEGTETLFGARTEILEDSPPGPRMAIPDEAQVVRRPARPYQAYLPPGAPVSLRGLAILRRQEQGLE